MAIRGGLAEFSIPELMQLLALQTKTGVLTLTHKGGHKHVLFLWRGRILAAADRRRNNRHEFLAYLYHNQFFTKDQVESVEDICRSTGQDLFTVILASGVMGRDRLAEEMHRFSQRMMDELVNWMDGSYEFASADEKSLPTHGLAIHLNPEELVLESMRRADELVTMQESMLAPNLLLARVKSAPREPLPRECTIALKMVDGTKTIQELCRTSPLGDFLTYEAIAELLGRQQIMIVDPEDSRRMAPPRPQGPHISWAALGAIISMVVGSVLLGAGLQPLLERSSSDDWMGSQVQERRAETQSTLAAEVEKLQSTISEN
jgi:hypothetical protein